MNSLDEEKMECMCSWRQSVMLTKGLFFVTVLLTEGSGRPELEYRDLHRLKQQLSAAGIPQDDEILDLAGGPAQIDIGNDENNMKYYEDSIEEYRYDIESIESMYPIQSNRMNSKTIQYAQEIDDIQPVSAHQIKNISPISKISPISSMTELGGMEEIKSIQEVSAIEAAKLIPLNTVQTKNFLYEEGLLGEDEMNGLQYNRAGSRSAGSRPTSADLRPLLLKEGESSDLQRILRLLNINNLSQIKSAVPVTSIKEIKSTVQYPTYGSYEQTGPALSNKFTLEENYPNYISVESFEDYPGNLNGLISGGKLPQGYASYEYNPEGLSGLGNPNELISNGPYPEGGTGLDESDGPPSYGTWNNPDGEATIDVVVPVNDLAYKAETVFDEAYGLDPVKPAGLGLTYKQYPASSYPGYENNRAGNRQFTAEERSPDVESLDLNLEKERQITEILDTMMAEANEKITGIKKVLQMHEVIRSDLINKLKDVKKVKDIKNRGGMQELKTIQEVKDMQELKSIQKVKDMQEINSINEVKDMQEIKGISDIISKKEILNKTPVVGVEEVKRIIPLTDRQAEKLKKMADDYPFAEEAKR